ncbi:hypothetical protein PVAP13_9KG028826 [Panicum virgatum]|uniref:Uncharacterized protein n=1 Tax=Panicum virgatum TaxID=38727 RepID=A0A8T0NGN8_PANVG|nr:hypothetical protein PVAP13_9KG028826 [Panicum virgatum]
MRTLNESLLLKWIWRLYNKGGGVGGGGVDQCCQLLNAKYLRGKPVTLCKKGVGSQFWRGLQQIRERFKWGATFTLGDGRNILFWEDVWVGDIPLRLEFPNLYEYSYNKNCVVSECWIEGEWKMNFRRSFGQDELLQWEQLLHIISQKLEVRGIGAQLMSAR